MFKWFRKLVNLCEHKWENGGNVIMKNGQIGHLQICDKCQSIKLNKGIQRAN